MSHSTTDPMEEQQTTEEINSTNSTNVDERDRKQFNFEIHRFMSENGKPLSKIPIMGYKELDLYQLFKEVTAHGGFNEVVKNVGTWSKIWKRLGNFDPSITDSSFRLKKNYERYLLDYEFKCFPDHKLQALEFQERSSMKRSNSTNNLGMVGNSMNISRPHSPTAVSTSSTTSTNGIGSPQFSSNTSSNNFHNSPESLSAPNSPTYQRKDSKSKSVLKKKRKSNTRHTPSRSNSFNTPMASLSISSRMPLVLDDLTIESLGTIIPRFPYISNGQIYPVGFTSHRFFTSRINPSNQVKYTSQIVDNGERPEFIVTASDDLENPVKSFESPSACWKLILTQLMELEESNASESSSTKLSVCGRLRFGLTHPDAVSHIKELPNYEKAFELIGSMSPSSKRKFQYISDDSADDTKSKTRKNFYQNSASGSRDDMDDLESAVATLQGLKHSMF